MMENLVPQLGRRPFPTSKRDRLDVLICRCSRHMRTPLQAKAAMHRAKPRELDLQHCRQKNEKKKFKKKGKAEKCTFNDVKNEEKRHGTPRIPVARGVCFLFFLCLI